MKAILVPSGDQAGIASGGPDGWLVIWFPPVPSALIAKIPPSIDIATRPSGDHAGSIAGCGLSLVWPVPSAFMIQTALEPSCWLSHAILEPFADHAGRASKAVLVVIRV